MAKHTVNIPAICPAPVGNSESLGSYVSSQPIMQLKELEPDRVRYDQWKASLSQKVKTRKSRSKQNGNDSSLANGNSNCDSIQPETKVNEE